MSTQSAIAAVLHDQLGEILVTVFKPNGRSPFGFAVSPGDGLLKQLDEPGDAPPRVSLGFGLDIVTNSVSALMDALPDSPAGASGLSGLPDVSRVLDDVRRKLGGKLGLFERQRDVIAGLIAARNPTSIRDAVGGLFQKILEGIPGSSTRDSVSRLREFIGNDPGTALPIATMVNAAQQGSQSPAGVPESVEQGVLEYFFKTAGYQTVDGESIVSPVHISDLKTAVAGAGSIAGGVQSLKGLASHATAERYLRDMTRIIVESAYDTVRGIKDTRDRQGQYSLVVSRLRNPNKFVAWFRGFSSMAESVAMRAVEIGAQGAAMFQTNELIGAAAGSFAGTVARKLGQDAFLSVLREELHV